MYMLSNISMTNGEAKSKKREFRKIQKVTICKDPTAKLREKVGAFKD